MNRQKPIPESDRRYHLKTFDKRFGSKAYIIFDKVNNSAYIHEGHLAPIIYRLHEGYLKGREECDRLNREFLHNLHYGKTKLQKADTVTESIKESVYDMLAKGLL